MSFTLKKKCYGLGGPTLLALLCLWEEELGRRRKRVTRHQHQLLELQQLLNVLFKSKIMDRANNTVVNR